MDEADEAEQRGHMIMRSNDIVDEKVGLVEAICQNDEVLVTKTRKRLDKHVRDHSYYKHEIKET